MYVINTRYFGRLYPVSWTITHHFGVSKRFLWLLKPKVCLRVVLQHLQFWPILSRFMGYYSPFWCPCAISLLVELQGPITCLRAGQRHSPFWLIRPVSCAIAHLFEVLERFPCLLNYKVLLRAFVQVIDTRRFG